MSFFSWSKKKKYKYDKYGNRHYQRKGLLGKLSQILRSSSYSNKNYNPNRYQRYQNYVPIQNRPNLRKLSCGRCQSNIPAGSKFCLECGEQVVTSPMNCTNCGVKLPNGAKFCSNCGTKTNR
ncbi:zinc ribbon domain-containing protein [Bacillus sp. FJAT-45350]|uniref:zinc ribbon domain-containing protein n=1 Tax=Bacillus sp. FJAT-45350 TaxID=2011014 RepID=UPI000BB80045